MIAANVGVTRYLKAKSFPSIRRVVKIPKRWNRIVQLARTLGSRLPPKPNAPALREFLLKEQTAHPDQFRDLSLAIIKLIGRGEYMIGLPNKISSGHFDLALTDYAHTTAPNRRYPDLVMQRLLKSSLFEEKVPYSFHELETIARQCTQKEDDATKVERRMIKSAAALVLSERVGEQFEALVTGASPKGTWVHLYDPPVEGKVVHGFEGLDVGDRVTVKLIKTDVREGHIDFRALRSC
jgi:exoribonuclease-2